MNKEHQRELAELYDNVSSEKDLLADLTGRTIIFRETHGHGELREIELVQAAVVDDLGPTLHVSTVGRPLETIKRSTVREIIAVS
jgi:hypothetical protein